MIVIREEHLLDNLKRNKILVVDDDDSIREVLRLLLESQNFQVVEAENGVKAVKSVNHNPDLSLVIMDVMMPGMTGFDACNLIRDISRVPILFLTAKSQSVDKEEAYNQGGDDYLVKPFTEIELLLKVKSLVRRYNSNFEAEAKQKDGEIVIGENILINLHNECVFKDGSHISLTDKEFKILKFFLEHRGQTVKNQEVYEDIWGGNGKKNTGNKVMVHILNLRRKLENDPANPTVIKTVWGKGYRID